MGQAQPPVSPGTHPLSESLSATASATGTASWVFPAPPAGQVATGTMCCATAPTTAIFTAAIGATILGDWAGSSVAGPWQSLNVGSPVTVTATGLTPGDSYLLNWIGSVDDYGSVQPEWPDTNISSLESLLASPLGIVFGPTALSASSGTASTGAFNVPDNARTLILVIAGAVVSAQVPTNIQIVGETTGIIYYNQAPYLIGAQSVYCAVVCPVNGAADESYAITATYATAPTFTPTFTVYADTDQYQEAEFYNGPAKIAGEFASSGTLAIGPCRLLGITAQFLSNAASQDALLEIDGTIVWAADSNATGQYQSFSFTFPPNTILALGQTVTFSVSGTPTFSNAALIYAYP